MRSPRQNTAPRTDADDFTVRELAAALRVHNQTIYKMLARGALRSYKVGHARRIPREEFDRIRGQARQRRN